MMAATIERDTSFDRTRRQTLSVAVGAAMLIGGITAGCQLGGTRGEGPVASETRDATAFTRVEVSSGIGVTVSIGPTQPLQVRGQENILPIITTKVEGDTLRIGSSRGFSTSETVEVVIVTPTLNGISMSGGSQGHVEGLEEDSLNVELSGGAGLTATGTTSIVALTMSGGSRATLDGLSAGTVTVDLSGGATATVQASDQVIGTASGGARISVLGDAQLNVETTGGSQVTHG